MEKIVYCTIGERCKCVKYMKHQNETDVECILRALKKICDTDRVLSYTMTGKAIVLQKSIPHKNNMLCDIEEDEDIPHKSEIMCLFVAIPDENKVIFSNVKPGDYTVEVDEEISNLTSSSTIFNTTDSYLQMIDMVLNEESPTESSKTQMNDPNSNTSIVQESEPCSSETKINKRVKTQHASILKSMQRLGSILNPASLPVLTPDLEKIASTIGVLQGQKSFIYFWTSDLLKSTNGNPTKRDYFNYAMNIVATYPELRGGANGCGIVRHQLSTNVRNRRANSKKLIAKTSGYGFKSEKTNALLVIDKQADDKDALKELEKCGNRSDTAHVRQLLRATLSIRRQWIEKEAKNISDIIAKHPQMKLATLVEFEFCIMLQLEKEEIYSKVDQMIEKLSKYYLIEQKDEESKAVIFVELWNTLTAKTQRKTCVPLLIVKEQMDSTTDLLSVKTASPRAVLYTAEGGIAAAFIVAEETIRMKIEKPTVSKAVACLVSSYFVWNTVYPPAYINTLEYIESEIVRPVKLKPTVEKFIRNRNQKLNLKS